MCPQTVRGISSFTFFECCCIMPVVQDKDNGTFEALLIGIFIVAFYLVLL